MDTIHWHMNAKQGDANRTHEHGFRWIIFKDRPPSSRKNIRARGASWLIDLWPVCLTPLGEIYWYYWIEGIMKFSNWHLSAGVLKFSNYLKTCFNEKYYLFLIIIIAVLFFMVFMLVLSPRQSLCASLLISLRKTMSRIKYMCITSNQPAQVWV